MKNPVTKPRTSFLLLCTHPHSVYFSVHKLLQPSHHLFSAFCLPSQLILPNWAMRHGIGTLVLPSCHVHQEKSQLASRSVTSVRRSGPAIANLARLGVPLFLQRLPSRGATSGSVRNFSGDRASLLKPATGSPFSPGRLPGAFWRSRTFAGTTSGSLPALLRFAGRVPLLLGRPLDFFWRSRVFAGQPLASPRSLPDGVWLPVLCSSGV